MKHKFLVVMILMVFLFTIGCGKKEEINETLIGTWHYYSGNKINELIVYQFNEDKTGSFTYKEDVTNFTYEYDENEIKIVYEDEKTANYKYKIEKDVLTIKDSFDDDITYKKEKIEEINQ